MTFPSTVKKSNTVKTNSKSGSESKALGSPGSPKLIGSLNTSVKSTSPGPSVKLPVANKVPGKINDELPVKSLTSKSISKPVIDVKSESIKSAISSAIKGEKKSVTKPPPLKLNIKTTDTKGLQSPLTPKFVSKTPTTPTVKSLALPKSPMITKPSSAVKSPSMSSTTKSSQESTVSSPVVKSSQVTAGSKSSTTSLVKSPSTLKSLPVTKSPQVTPSKSSVVISSIAKSPLIIKNPTSKTLTVPKSPLSTKPLTPTVKSVLSKPTIKDSHMPLKSVSTKDQTSGVKSTTTKKVTVLSTNSVAGVKSPTTPTTKSSIILSPSMTSCVKPISLKVPLSPSKPVTKQFRTAKVSSPIKSNVSKPGPTSPKVMVKNESSTLLSLSAKLSSTVKSTSSIVSKTSTAVKTKLIPSAVSKNLVPKSPIVKTPPSPKMKTPSLSIVKTPLSPVMKTKTPPSPTVKTKTPPSPIVKTRTTSLSTAIPPLSPVIKKMVPTKLILSPGLTKSGSLSSSKLNSVSTDSLASRTSLKSPMSPRPTKLITKRNLIDIQNAEEPKSKGIRGKQPVTKIIEIPGISELSSNLAFSKLETQDIECRLENTTENIPKEEIEMEIIQIPDQDSLCSEELEKHSTVNKSISFDDSLEVTNNLANEETISLNVTNTQNINELPVVQEYNLLTIKEDSSIEPSIPSLEVIRQNEHSSSSLDFEVVKKHECVPSLNTISQSVNNFDIAFDDNHFGTTTNEYIIVEQLNKTQLCIADIDDREDNFEPMNDKLVLGDVPFETDSSDVSDNEQTVLNEIITTQNDDVSSNEIILPLLNEEDLSICDFEKADSIDTFFDKLMSNSTTVFEGNSSISTDDERLSRKSYSEVVSGSPKYKECYFDYDFEVADDCLDYDEKQSEFVEVSEKEFPELKSDRKKNKKQKKRNYSNRTESQSGKYN